MMHTPLAYRSTHLPLVRSLLQTCRTPWRDVLERWNSIPADLHCLSMQLLRRQCTFTFNGLGYPYFCHCYNWTWENERSVEVPIAWELARQYPAADVLEVGNVLPHTLE